jgi:hypothetical protein
LLCLVPGPRHLHEHLFGKSEHLHRVSEHLPVLGEHCSASALVSRKKMANLIRDLVKRFLKARLVTDGPDDVVPKHHCTMHLWEQFLEDGMVLDTWVLERMHLLLKKYADGIANTGAFEKIVIGRAVLDRMRQLRRISYEDKLIGPCVQGVGRDLKMKSGRVSTLMTSCFFLVTSLAATW